jgi:hypothetical protein
MIKDFIIGFLIGSIVLFIILLLTGCNNCKYAADNQIQELEDKSVQFGCMSLLVDFNERRVISIKEAAIGLQFCNTLKGPK